MSLFGGYGAELEEDPIFGQMNSVMNSFFGGDPFGGLLGGMGMQPFGRMMSHNALMAPHHQNPLMGHHHQNAMMPFGFPPMGRPGGFMTNMMPAPGSASFTSTSYVTMSAGPDGRQQIYQASSSTKTGPNGVMETKKTVQDSRTGVKKMAIGHHIYDRGHIIEREQNLHQGTEEERQDFINLEEEDADEFNREFLTKSAAASRRPGPSIQCIETGPLARNQMPAIMPAAQVSAKPVEVVEEEEDEEEEEEGGEGATEPIIELPESPQPEEDKDGGDVAQEKERFAGDGVTGVSSRAEVSPGVPGDNYGQTAGRARHSNPLGVHPRPPIRTHQASPLATMTRRPGGHSMKSSSNNGGAHPYSAQQNRKAHRPMKTVQYHNNSYHQQHPPQPPPQYDGDD